MDSVRTLASSAALSVMIGLSALSFEAQGTVLLQNWGGSGDSGFGDLAMDRNDDGSSSRISFDQFADLGFDGGVNFFGNNYDSFFINNNGNVTFNGPLSFFTPQTFPVSNQPMIAPFWADVDTRCAECGEVYIGSPDEDTLVVTWNEVGFYSQNTSSTNTFQLVLIDREDTGAGNFDVEFRYEDINWTTGQASEGDENGLGGTPAQVGYDAGDGENFFTVPGSQTADIVNIDTNDSNTGTPGIWKFAIRDGLLPGETPENPILPIVNPTTPSDYEFEFTIDDPADIVFIDPDVAVGYDYISNSGPNFASVLLPTGFDDNMFDLFLWDAVLMDWVDSGIDLMGGVEHVFNTPLDRFRIMGIDISEMVDPLDPTAFVTGLTFDSSGVINMNQNAVTVFVPDPTSVPEPGGLVLILTSLGLLVLRNRRKLAS